MCGGILEHQKKVESAADMAAELVLCYNMPAPADRLFSWSVFIRSYYI